MHIWLIGVFVSCVVRESLHLAFVDYVFDLGIHLGVPFGLLERVFLPDFVVSDFANLPYLERVLVELGVERESALAVSVLDYE